MLGSSLGQVENYINNKEMGDVSYHQCIIRSRTRIIMRKSQAWLLLSILSIMSSLPSPARVVLEDMAASGETASDEEEQNETRGTTELETTTSKRAGLTHKMFS